MTAGSQSLTATDAIAPSISGGQSAITVQRGAATHLSLTGLPASAMAGTPLTVTVMALDAGNNIATSFLDRVSFGSNDAQAGLPSGYTFVASDNGVRQFTVIFKTAGARHLSVGGFGSLQGAQETLAVTPAGASRLTMYGASTANTGYNHNVYVTALDAFSNTATGYTGTVALQSSDLQAGLPDPYSFTASDSGTHGFEVTLNTAGSQTVTVTDGTYTLVGVAPRTHMVRIIPTTSVDWVPDTLVQTVVIANDGTVSALFPPPPPVAHPSDQSIGQGYTRVSDVPQPPGVAETTLNFGVYHQGSLSGLVFQDSNRNGTQDQGKPSLAGRTVFLDQLHNGTPITNETSFPATAPPLAITDADPATDQLSGDYPNTTSATLAVSGVRGLVAGVTLTVNITGNPSTEKDLSVVLVSPLGRQADVFDNVSGGLLSKDLSDFNND
jgi:hypothetical protein